MGWAAMGEAALCSCKCFADDLGPPSRRACQYSSSSWELGAGSWELGARPPCAFACDKPQRRASDSGIDEGE